MSVHNRFDQSSWNQNRIKWRERHHSTRQNALGGSCCIKGQRPSLWKELCWLCRWEGSWPCTATEIVQHHEKSFPTLWILVQKEAAHFGLSHSQVMSRCLGLRDLAILKHCTKHVCRWKRVVHEDLGRWMMTPWNALTVKGFWMRSNWGCQGQLHSLWLILHLISSYWVSLHFLKK